MQHRLPLIHQIQADAVDSSKSVVQVVRTAKIAASKLGLTEAIDWIDNELNGYPTSDPKKLPAYRVTHGECQGWNPYHGWLPVIIQDSKIHELFCITGIRQPLASVEDLIRDPDSASPVMPYGHLQQEALRKFTGQNTKFQLKLSRATATHILDGVRSQVLDWSLELEAAGVLGENMSFKHDERQAAQTLTQTIYVQNAGVIGNVSDQASVSITQTANIDVGQAKQLIDQIIPLVQQLPEALQTQLVPVIQQSSECLSQRSPDQGRLRELLTSARNICEGAAGSILATGIAASLTSLL